MAPMSSAELREDYTPAEQDKLLGIACGSIRCGLEHGRPAPVSLDGLPASLAAELASFVTLNTSAGQLRGCIGSLEAYRPLAEDVSHNAWAAAFRDPRFSPLQEHEFPGLDIHVSVLGSPEPVEFSSEQELLSVIRPGVDGLILEDSAARGTFLPSVWESLPDPAMFLAHLKLKADLPVDHWSDRLRIWRYTTQSFGKAVREIHGEMAAT